MSYSIVQADAMEWLKAKPDNYADLVMCSPPYEKARTYLEDGVDLGIARDTEEWVAWLKEIYLECVRVCSGLVCFVVEGQTKNYRWSAGPALLMADLHRAGVRLRKPPIFHRVGIPGSGGPDYWRNDYEFCICSSKGKLPWSDNTAVGKPPKWEPGGEMSYRKINGDRVGKMRAMVEEGGGEPKVLAAMQDSMASGAKLHTKRRENGSQRVQYYVPPKLANPGNVIHCKVGGGRMGHPSAHKNEAPYPEALVEPFVRCFCRPGGIVLDPFVGSGTTVAVAYTYCRIGEGCDMRASQVEEAKQRLSNVTPKALYGE